MLIHSVTSLHMLTDSAGFPEMTCKRFEGGYIEGYDTPGGFQMARLHSTDPAMYLKKEFSPGGFYDGQ